METIIGLLFILLPVIFKLIGKRFEQSGQQDKARKVREFAQALDGEDSPMHDWGYFGKEVLGVEGEPQEEEILPQTPAPASLPQTSVEAQPAFTRKPMLREEEPQKKGEKIDPKKLVIYSEIMKPKF